MLRRNSKSAGRRMGGFETVDLAEFVRREAV